MGIRDLNEHVERHLPLLELDVLTNIPDRLAVVCYGVFGQSVDSPPQKCERIIHVMGCHLVPGALAQTTTRTR